MLTTFEHNDIKSIQRILLNGASQSFAVKACGAGLAFLLQVILARSMGVSEYGVYSFILSLVMVATLFAPLGINKTVVKFIPEYVSSNSYLSLRKYIRWSLFCTLSFSFFVALTFSVFTSIRIITIENTTIIALFIGCLLIPTNALIQLGIEIARAFRRVVFSEFLNTILRPILILITIALISKYPIFLINTKTVLIINFFTGLVVLYLLYTAYNSFIKLLPSQQSAPVVTDPRLWIATAIPLLLVASGNLVLGRTDVIMIGSITDTTQAGLYNASERISYLIGFPLLAINTIVAPLIAQLFSQKRHPDLQSIVSRSAWICFLSSAALTTMVFVFNKNILSFFGNEFISQYDTLNILLIGQLFCSMTGAAGYLLAMSGKHINLAIIVIISAVINVTLNIYLIPLFGNIGAAFGTVFSLILSNILMATISIFSLNINPTIFSLKKYRASLNN